MKSRSLRSTGVNETLTVPLRARPTSERLDFDALYRASRDDVYAYVATLLRDAASAEDVTALAFERALHRQRSYRPGRGTERAWLFGIARNAALDELRRRKRSAALVTEPEDLSSAETDEDDDRRLNRATVRAALDGLAPRERELIGLKFHAGLSNPEIAKVLGVSESNAGTLLHRAMQQLRKACHETS